MLRWEKLALRILVWPRCRMMKGASLECLTFSGFSSVKRQTSITSDGKRIPWQPLRCYVVMLYSMHRCVSLFSILALLLWTFRYMYWILLNFITFKAIFVGFVCTVVYSKKYKNWVLPVFLRMYCKSGIKCSRRTSKGIKKDFQGFESPHIMFFSCPVSGWLSSILYSKYW